MPISVKWTITLLTAVVVFAATLGVGYAVTGEFTPPVTALAAVLASATVAIGGASVARQRARDRREPPPPPPTVHLDSAGPITGTGNAVVGSVAGGDIVTGSQGRQRRRRSGNKPSA
jgi:hypothetical protein